MEKPTVVAREVLHDGVALGTVIEVAVPKKAKRLSFPVAEGESGNSYLHFSWQTKGGTVNMHVRSDEEVQNRKIWAQVQIVKKTMSDGREFLYMDMFPVAKQVTHWFHIFGSEHEAYPDWQVFELDDFVPTIALVKAGDKRCPVSRDIVRYADAPVSGFNSPFAALAAIEQ